MQCLHVTAFYVYFEQPSLHVKRLMTNIKFVRICESVREMKHGYRNGHRIYVVANMNLCIRLSQNA